MEEGKIILSLSAAQWSASSNSLAFSLAYDSSVVHFDSWRPGSSGSYAVSADISETGANGAANISASISNLANDAAIEALTVATSTGFAVSVSDGSLTRSKALTINIAQDGTTESTGNDKLTGTSGNDKFDGLAGNDIINGLAGADIMKGGSGNDVYVVDNPGDVVTETSALITEIDKVNSSVSYTLTANVENLTLTGTASVNGTGNTLNNVLTGNAGANILNGAAGNDSLIGCDLNLKQPQQKERQRDLFFAKTESIVEPLKLMPVNLKCQQHPVVSSAYRQDKISVL